MLCHLLNNQVQYNPNLNIQFAPEPSHDCNTIQPYISLADEQHHSSLELLVPMHTKYKNHNFSEVAKQMRLKREHQAKTLSLQKNPVTKKSAVQKSIMNIFEQLKERHRQSEDMGVDIVDKNDRYEYMQQQKRLIKIVREEQKKFFNKSVLNSFTHQRRELERLVDDGYTSNLRNFPIVKEEPSEVYQVGNYDILPQYETILPTKPYSNKRRSVCATSKSPLFDKGNTQLDQLLTKCSQIPLNSEVTRYYRSLNTSFIDEQSKSQEELYQAIEAFQIKRGSEARQADIGSIINIIKTAIFHINQSIFPPNSVIFEQLQSNVYKRKSLINTSWIARSQRKPSSKARRGYFR